VAAPRLSGRSSTSGKITTDRTGNNAITRWKMPFMSAKQIHQRVQHDLQTALTGSHRSVDRRRRQLKERLQRDRPSFVGFVSFVVTLLGPQHICQAWWRLPGFRVIARSPC